MSISQKKNNIKFHICGLGNYGNIYRNHRHNFGSIVINYLQQNLQFSTTEEENFFVYEGVVQDIAVVLLIPKNFMNCVGDILSNRLRYFKTDVENLCVLHDDLEITLGQIRYRFGQGTSGHNGLRSIDKVLGKNYHRLSLGIGRPLHRWQVKDFVLGNFSQQEFDQVYEVCDRLLLLLPYLVTKNIVKLKEGYRDVT